MSFSNTGAGMGGGMDSRRAAEIFRAFFGEGDPFGSSGSDSDDATSMGAASDASGNFAAVRDEKLLDGPCQCL